MRQPGDARRPPSARRPSPREQQAPRDRAATRRDDRHLAVGDLPRAALAAERPDALGEEPEAVEAAAGELPTPRVERQRAAEAHAAALDEGARLAALAEAERLDPRERQPAEAVVELD